MFDCYNCIAVLTSIANVCAVNCRQMNLKHWRQLLTCGPKIITTDTIVILDRWLCGFAGLYYMQMMNLMIMQWVLQLLVLT